MGKIKESENKIEPLIIKNQIKCQTRNENIQKHEAGAAEHIIRQQRQLFQPVPIAEHPFCSTVYVANADITAANRRLKNQQEHKIRNLFFAREQEN